MLDSELCLLMFMCELFIAIVDLAISTNFDAIQSQIFNNDLTHKCCLAHCQSKLNTFGCQKLMNHVNGTRWGKRAIWNGFEKSDRARNKIETFVLDAVRLSATRYAFKITLCRPSRLDKFTFLQQWSAKWIDSIVKPHTNTKTIHIFTVNC